MSKVRKFWSAAVLAAAALLGAGPAEASLYVFSDSGSGNIPSTSDAANSIATFDWSGSTMVVHLFNSGVTSGGNGSVLTGMLFNTSGNNAVSDTTPTVTAALSWNGTIITANVDYTNKWVFVRSDSSGASLPSGQQYGLSTTNATAMFAQSLFPGGSGADDYGVIGSATPCNTSGTASGNCVGNIDTSANKYPLAVGALEFTFLNFALTQITSVTFLYTSSGQSLTTAVVPEPISLALLAPAAIGLGLLRRRRRG